MEEREREHYEATALALEEGAGFSRLEKEKKILTEAPSLNLLHMLRTSGVDLSHFMLFYESRSKHRALMESYFDRYSLREEKRKTIYKPIAQIAAFENHKLLAPSAPDQAAHITRLVETFLNTYLVRETTHRDGSSFYIRMDSERHRFAAYLQQLAKDYLWQDTFFRRKHPDLLRIIEEGMDAPLRPDRNTDFIGQHDEPETIVPPDGESPPFEAQQLAIRVTRELFDQRDPDRQYATNPYLDLLRLLDYLRTVEFLSDVYGSISEEIWETYREQEEAFAAEYQQAGESFRAGLAARIIPVAKEYIEHKTGLAKAKAKGVKQAFVPFDEKAALLPNGTKVFIYSEGDGSWSILPPTEQPLDLNGLSYSGTYEYEGLEQNGSNVEHYVRHRNAEGVDTGRYTAKLNLAVFEEVLAEHYGEFLNQAAVLDSRDLVEEFPKFFAKTELRFEDGEKDEAPAASDEARRLYHDIFLTEETGGESRRVTKDDWLIRVGEPGTVYRVEAVPFSWSENLLKVRRADAALGLLQEESLQNPEDLRFAGSQSMTDLYLETREGTVLYGLLRGHMERTVFAAMSPLEANSLRHERTVQQHPERFAGSQLVIYRLANQWHLARGRELLDVVEIPPHEGNEEALRNYLDERSREDADYFAELGIRTGRTLFTLFDGSSFQVESGLMYEVGETAHEEDEEDDSLPF